MHVNTLPTFKESLITTMFEVKKKRIHIEIFY